MAISFCTPSILSFRSGNLRVVRNNGCAGSGHEQTLSQIPAPGLMEVLSANEPPVVLHQRSLNDIIFTPETCCSCNGRRCYGLGKLVRSPLSGFFGVNMTYISGNSLFLPFRLHSESQSVRYFLQRSDSGMFCQLSGLSGLSGNTNPGTLVHGGHGTL